MSISISVPPNYSSSLPIDLSLLKQHCSIIPTETEHEGLLRMYCIAAAEHFEAVTKRAIFNQTVVQSFDRFPCEHYFLLERIPYVSGLAISYYDHNDELQTFDASNYQIDSSKSMVMVSRGVGKSWPTTSERLRAVRVQYVAGHGTTSTTIPVAIQRILAILAADSFLYREDTPVAPGAVQIKTTLATENAIKMWMSIFYEHRSQKVER